MSTLNVKIRKSKFQCTAIVRMPDVQKRAKRVSDKDFFIPNFTEFSLLTENNYRVPQLKKICKHYQLKVSGNKNVLLNKIYRHLYLSNFAISIQKFIRGYLTRKWCLAHGPAYINRSLCTNNTDFFTMQELNTIPINQFFSYKDKDDFIYGFDIISLYTLYQNATEKGEHALNPYNRNELPPNLLKKLRTVIRISRVLNFEIQIEIEEDDINPKKQMELRILSLFQSIDALGNYSNTAWFTSLSREQIVIFLRELHDIWSYRAQLSDTIKREIAPPVGDPFRGTNMHYLSQLPMESVKKLAVSIMEILVRKGINHDSQVLGANYVLCALTLVNLEAATALPWLYQSVAHIV